MLRQLSNGNWVWQISADMRGSLPFGVIQSLSLWCQSGRFSREAGGLVLGFIDIETSGLLADSITTPCRGDKRSRYSFYRGNCHQVKATQWHHNTNGHGAILGLWHSHPESMPNPSGTDWSDLAKMLRHGTYSEAGLFYLIVGTKYIGCWFGQRDGEIHFIGNIPV